jgi:Cu(I)/Ag(I) efflux system protein CusF
VELRFIATALMFVSILVSCGGSPAEESAPPPEQEAAAPQDTPPQTPVGTREDPFVGRGTIRAVQAEQRQLLIQHGDIPGFMGAMMMVFAVDPATSIDGLEIGDEVNFNIERVGDNQYQIFAIQEEAAETAAEEPE